MFLGFFQGEKREIPTNTPLTHTKLLIWYMRRIIHRYFKIERFKYYSV